MKNEKPILFSSEMVRAILDGRKTMTRRVVNWQKIAKQTGCTKGTLGYSDTFHSWAVFDGNGEADLCLLDCPYGKPGNHLWVRETFAIAPNTGAIFYRTGKMAEAADQWGMKWKSSIHMPRWASRITLEITNVRVERLQDISEEDARDEGVENLNLARPFATDAFEDLWDKINGKKYPWSSNPWVWCISFRRAND